MDDQWLDELLGETPEVSLSWMLYVDELIRTSSIPEEHKVEIERLVETMAVAELYDLTTYLRDSRGLLVDRSDALIRARQTDVDLLPDLKAAIARAAAEGKPYTKTGGNGVYERRHELPEAFHAIGKHRLADWVGTLLDREELVMAMVDGSKLVKWLDVPDGPMASGEAAFVTGHLKRSQPGRQEQR